MTEQKPSDKPPVEAANITFERALCPPHGEIFRAKWPAGYALLIAEGFKRLGAAGGLMDVDGEDDAQRNRQIEAILDEKPICCRLGKTALMALYMWINRQHKQKLWTLARCVACKKIRRGGRYRAREGADNPEVLEHRHICLHCVVHAIKRKGGAE